MKFTKAFSFSFLAILCVFTSCQDAPQEQKTTVEAKPTFQNKGHELVYNLTQKVGDYSKLAALKDVVYTYSYKMPDGSEDISTEKYIFDGELSYARYDKHERTLADYEGTIEQGYDGTNFWFKHNSEKKDDVEAVERAKFSRKTNFYWFAMLQKLLDPGVAYEHLEEVKIDENAYDVVNVTFKSDQPTDIYRLFINQKTGLMDQFLFTVVDFNVVDTPLLMKVDYEAINGINIPSKRKYTRSTWEAEVPDDVKWINVTWSDIKFDNGLTQADFE